MLGEMVSAERRKIYLNIKGGAIVRRTPDGEENSFSYVEGRLEAINQKERTFRGEVVIYWYIDLRDDESGELYSLGSSYASNTFKSIILQLASERGLESVKSGSTIRIEPYSRGGYDKVQVYGGGVKLDWVTKQLPPVEETTIGGRRIKDDSKRMALISSLADNIKSAIPPHRGDGKKVLK